MQLTAQAKVHMVCQVHRIWMHNRGKGSGLGHRVFCVLRHSCYAHKPSKWSFRQFHCRALDASIREGEQQQSALPLTLRGRYTAPLHAQLGRLLLKDLRSYWRTPEYNATRLTISLGVALIFGSMYWMRAHHRFALLNPAASHA